MVIHSSKYLGKLPYKYYKKYGIQNIRELCSYRALYGETDMDSDFLLDIPIFVSLSCIYGYWNYIGCLLGNQFSDSSGIYFIKNLDKDKSYVGQGVRMMNRCRQHFMPSDKTGIPTDLFKRNVFAVNFIAYPECILNEMEHKWIELFDCVKCGYNTMA